ncbi:Hypothetical predicted protein [Mytilus galloprovincialis]|uniref:Endonuclease/exonuclease/phosphatase domain-containing protein n=1 Tax=Mytilus galloprovincialis TaxID=29158 RepID=A0A8B6G2H1_MYTGA|nr:Hypothetical predicted protein [Mytilus galloprovincialis]
MGLYVDNILTSFDNENSVIDYYRRSRELLTKGGFNLRSWNSNSPKLQEIASKEQTLDKDELTKILGMQWNAKSDKLFYQSNTLCGDNVWRYCPTKDNPADLLTRGITSEELQQNEIWFSGPKWLNSKEDWPTWNGNNVTSSVCTTMSENDDKIETMENNQNVCIGIGEIIDIERYNSYRKLTRITAYVMRFATNCRAKETERKKDLLRIDEIENAKFLWIRYKQEPPDLKSDDTSEQLWVKVQIIGSPDLYIGSFYKPPNKTEEDCLTHLGKTRIRQSNNCHLWLGGDFNLGGIDWNNYSIKQKAYNPKQCQQLIDICQDNYLEQVVTTPTHFTETSQAILDLFFTSNSSLVNKTEVIPGISDHEIVYIESNVKHRRAKKKKN